ncbi:hypothetical protein FLA_0263 [Filimonas lacunae]|nr:hypothetical protein FLA_0263 [Filimonas lacunae]
MFITANLAAFPGKNYTVGNTKKKAALAKAASVFVGYRIYLNPLSDYNSFYIQGDAGVSAVTTKLINPAIAPSIGFLINDKLDLSLKYQKILSNNKYADYSFIALGIGYGFNFN